MFVFTWCSIYGDIGDYDSSLTSKDTSSSKRDKHKSKDRSHDRSRNSDRHDDHRKSKSNQYFEKSSHSEKEVSSYCIVSENIATMNLSLNIMILNSINPQNFQFSN